MRMKILALKIWSWILYACEYDADWWLVKSKHGQDITFHTKDIVLMISEIVVLNSYSS